MADARFEVSMRHCNAAGIRALCQASNNRMQRGRDVYSAPFVAFAESLLVDPLSLTAMFSPAVTIEGGLSRVIALPPNQGMEPTAKSIIRRTDGYPI